VQDQKTANVLSKLQNSTVNVMLSVLINKIPETNQFLINDFSRISPLISNKLNGPPKPGCNKPKRLSSTMSEQRHRRNEPATSSSYNLHYSNHRPVVHNHLSRVQNKRKQNEKRAEESIFGASSPNLIQLNGFGVRPPVWAPRPPRNYSLVYQNFLRAVLPPHLSNHCFHRPNLGNQQRNTHSAASNVGEPSINDLRFWEKLSTKSEKSGFAFTIMTYNVLAQDLIEQHPYLYSLHNREFLQWQVRWNNLIAEIRHFNPDILCLQEVQGSHLKTYFSSLGSLGYLGLYKQRTGIRTDGCAIYFKQDLVNLIEHTTVEYNQPNVPMLDRDNVAIIAKFSPKNNPDKEFVVATTHLLYNPKRQDVRLAQTQLLLTEVDRIAFGKRNNYLPVIVTGDLNSTPDSAVYKFITTGRLKYEELSPRSLQNGTAGPKTGKNFLPTSLRITDQCQHADLLPKREKNGNIPRSEELKLIELKHSERQQEDAKNRTANKNEKKLFASGTLSHKFSLQSVYKHQMNGDVEGTTFQDKWVSVDYIFFSKRQPNVDDLTLLERYKLPTESQLGNVKIPNTHLGSDHLSLLAKFLLKV
jgi:protein angel